MYPVIWVLTDMRRVFPKFFDFAFYISYENRKIMKLTLFYDSNHLMLTNDKTNKISHGVLTINIQSKQ